MSADDARQAVAAAAPFDPGDREPPAGVAELDWRLRKAVRNDVGNARRLKARFGDQLRHVQGIGWHGWDGRRWNREDGERAAQLRAQETASAIFAEHRAIKAGGSDPDEDLKVYDVRLREHASWAVSSGNSPRLAAMLREAAPHLACGVDQLDQQPYLLTVANGTLELPERVDPKGHGPDAYKAVRRRAHAQGDLITRLAPVAHDPAATCPAFEAFLAQILPDEAVALFMQRYLGSCLSGDISEQQLVLMIGTGANGKGTLSTAVMEVLGDYALAMDFTSLLHNDRKRGGDATPDLARLPGVRLAAASEPEQGARFSEALLKSMTGQDRIVARKLNEDPFEFMPQFHLLLSANNRPQIRGQDEGIWRRLNVVPFDVVVPRERRNLHLREALREERPGILNWLIQGYLDWRAGGLAPPDAVKAQTAAYRAESDPVGEFLLAACERSDPLARDAYFEPAASLYAAYVTWCKESAIEPWTGTSFGRALTERGFDKEKVGGAIRRTGLRLTFDWLAAHPPKHAGKDHARDDGAEDDPP